MSSQMCHDFTWDILYWAGKAAAWLGVRDSLQTNFKFTHSEQKDWRQCFQKDNTQKMWLFKAILCKLRKKSLGRERSRTWSPTIYCYYWKRKGKVLVTQSCPTLWHPMDCSPAGSSVHAIVSARILEWVAMPFYRKSSRLRVWTQDSYTAGRFFTI